MGKQVCFFVTNEDVKVLTQLVESKGGVLVNSSNELKNVMTDGKLYIVLKNSKVYYWENGSFFKHQPGKHINPQSSDVIEFCNCQKVFNQEKYPNGYEHGRFWYETSYFDNDGNLVKKSKEIDSCFNALKRFVVKNFILSKNREWYIGPDAYKKYVEGNFVPYSGINPIEFPKE